MPEPFPAEPHAVSRGELIAVRLKAVGRVIANHPRALLGLAGVIAALLIPALAGCQAEAGYRYAGLVLELGGLGIVAYGLHKTRVEFGRPAIRKQFASFWKQLLEAARVKPPPAGRDVILHAEPGRITLTGFPATLTVERAPGLEERLRAVEQSVRDFRAEVGKVRGEVAEHVRSIQAQVLNEAETRERNVGEVRKLIEAQAVGGLSIETVGLIWLLFGSVFSTISSEIAALARVVGCR